MALILRGAPAAFAFVVLMGLLSSLPSLWTRDLLGNGEVRLTEGARELVESPAGILPRVNGGAVVTESPVPYWATALLWKAGAGLASARLLSAVSVIGMALACFAAAAAGGLGGATMAAAIALTTAALFWHAREGGPEPFQALLLTWALLAGYKALNGKHGGRTAWWLACYAGAALAVLAMGVSAALVTLLVLGVYGIATGRPALTSARSHLPGLVLFAGAMAAWLVGISRASPGSGLALRLLTRDIAGFAESMRAGGLAKSVLVTGAALLPWIVVAPGPFLAAFRDRRAEARHLPFFAAVWLGALAVPAVLGGRKGAPDYVIAAVPPLAILCAGALVPGPGPRPTGRMRRGLVRAMLGAFGILTGGVLLLGLFHLAGGTYFIVGQRYVCPVTDQPYSPYALALTLPFVAASLASTVAAFRTPADRPTRPAWLLVLAVFLLGIPADLFLTPVVNAYESCRPFAGRILQHVQPSDGLYLYRTDYHGVYNLYTGRTPIPVLKTEGGLLERLSEPGTFVIAEEKRTKHARVPAALTGLVVTRGRVGHRAMLLLSSVPPAGLVPGAPPGR